MNITTQNIQRGGFKMKPPSETLRHYHGLPLGSPNSGHTATLRPNSALPNFFYTENR